MSDKIVVGLTTPITIFGSKGKRQVIARVDTGATKSSIDEKLAAELGMGTELRRVLIKSAHGNRHRGLVSVEIEMKGQRMKAECTLADREHMKYKMLIGQNILKKGFLIDPQGE